MTLPTSHTVPTVTLLIPNMHCPSCVESITLILSPVPHLKDLNVSLLVRSVTFQVDTSIGSSGKRKAAKEVEEDVKRLLESEGGFVVDRQGGAGPVHRSEEPRRKISRRKMWFGLRLGRPEGQTAEEKERDRRARHLAHCDVCQEEDANQNGSSVGPANAVPGSFPQALRTTFSISGMTCASCVQAITLALRSDSRVIAADVDLLSSSGVVVHYTKYPVDEIAEEIEDLGYGAEVIASTEEPLLHSHSPSGPLDGQETHEESRDDTAHRTILSIEGMTCSSCVNAISTALRSFDGIQGVSIDVMGNSATIQHANSVTIADIIDAIEGGGYGAKEISSVSMPQIHDSPDVQTRDARRTTHIAVDGTYCHKCISQLNTALTNLPVLRSTSFSLKDPSTKITYDPKQIHIRQILKYLDDLAPEFESRLVKPRSVSERSREIQAREVKNLAIHLSVAVIFAVPTFIIAIIGMILLPDGNAFKGRLMRPVWGAANVATLVLWPLATVVQFGVGRLFYVRSLTPAMRRLRTVLTPKPHPKALLNSHRVRIRAWKSFFNFGSMDLLVALSTSVAYFSSVAMLIIDVRSPAPSHSIGTYFDSSVFLIMFILLGRVLEAYARSRTTDAVSLLGQLRPETALLVERSESISTSDEGKGPSGTESASPSMICHDIDNQCKDTTIPSKIDRVEESTAKSRTTKSIPVDHLERDDLILIPPGSLPPTDGVIVLGETTFDESSLTGESHPVTKTPGDQVYTGTTNLSSAITVRVTSLPSETMLDTIIGAVSNASTHKAPIEKLAERLTGVFVPIVVYLSLIVLAIWLSLALTGHLDRHGSSNGGQVFFAIEFAIATLVVACPCGIGLAVPCANAVGNGLAAKAGILASGGGEAFLAATKVGTVVLDKTGTLTEGKCQVTDEQAYEGPPKQTRATFTRDFLFEAVLEVENGSTHPLAKGLVQHLENTLGNSRTANVQVVSTEEIAGRGIKAVVRVNENPMEILLGNTALLLEHELELSEAQSSQMGEWYDQAKSVILVAVRSNYTSTPVHVKSSETQTQLSALPFELVHACALSDPPRPSTLPVISALQKRGVKVIMLSGDSPRTASAVAQMVGIAEGNVIAGVGPLEKADKIKDLQQEPTSDSTASTRLAGLRIWKRRDPSTDSAEKVMFIGDGLNDAVALAAADVSVAMGHGSQAVLAGSDFVLLSSSLSALPALFSLSRKVYNRQRLNLLWAIIFNLVCIPFAAGVFYPAGGLRLTPVWSAVLMALSSVSVVLSSLAMRWGL